MSESSVKTVDLKLKNKAIRRIPFAQFVKENMGILIGLLLLCIILTIQSPVFLSKNNILNVLRQVATNLYIACAMTMIIILGESIFLSVP